MNRDAMVFAMANPNPEITPEEAAPYARVIATGRSDYPNQINNVLCFPGIFRGALDVRARDITEEMKMAAARGIASHRRRRRAARGLRDPERLQPRRRDAVAAAVADQAKAQGTAEVARLRGRLLARRDGGVQSRPALSAVPRHAHHDHRSQRADRHPSSSPRSSSAATRSPGLAAQRTRRTRAASLAGRDAIVHLAGENVAQRWTDERPQGDPRVARAGHPPARRGDRAGRPEAARR